jgi:hypothetical protein
MRDPYRLALDADAHGRFLRRVIPIHRREVLPMFAIVTEHRNVSAFIETAPGPVIVFADKIRERDRSVRVRAPPSMRKKYHVACRLRPRSSVWPFDVAAKVIAGDLFDSPKRAAFEIFVERDRRRTTETRESKHCKIENGC